MSKKISSHGPEHYIQKNIKETKERRLYLVERYLKVEEHSQFPTSSLSVHTPFFPPFQPSH
jgi:hypothetical protein